MRTVAPLLPLVARQRKAKRGVQEFATANQVVYLLATLVASDIASSRQLLPLVARQRKV
ncbi:hypothetical protein [Pilibacter termitis]|uniref:hypothetical protein n=1 Tax=Pilibacter termitis TaxID=263852 RepID=UPI00135646D1|nr:hypothetical protein [Pilibacter termitis]